MRGKKRPLLSVPRVALTSTWKGDSMSTQYARPFTRRRFLTGLTVAGTGGLLGLRASPAQAEPPPETTRIRLVKVPSICRAPQFIAEVLLAGEGFTEVHYIEDTDGGVGTRQSLASGEVDLSMSYVGPLIKQIDTKGQIVFLAGVQVGCFELIGTEQVRAIRDLKGKTVAVTGLGGSDHVFIASMAAYVGLDPQRQITWVTYNKPTEAAQLLVAGQIDALMAFPPFVQELRARQIGHVVVKSTVDRPWSQYFCCLLTGNQEFVRNHPVATKRALRAILKAADLCATDPESVARFLVSNGYTTQYDYALQALKDIPYNQWREYDPEETVRFYALRLHELGMIRSSPQKIIAQGTDWRFLNELKKEMKG
jgi:NitT/TauT family transport system substrate-binding protein